MLSRIKQIISKQKEKLGPSEKNAYEVEHDEQMQRIKYVINNQHVISD
jgi:hypothetical protein